MPIRFHLDEHISASIAAGLRRRAIDVTTTADAGLAGADDLAQLAFAATSGRVLVTSDADFLRLHAEGAAHMGIAFWHQETRPTGEILRRLLLIHDILSPEEISGKVEFL